MTANPDFGQVEADEAILNLSTFETFFPEKRPFFIEGPQIFDTPMGLFYSRRIGRSPSGSLPIVAQAAAGHGEVFAIYGFCFACFSAFNRTAPDDCLVG